MREGVPGSTESRAGVRSPSRHAPGNRSTPMSPLSLDRRTQSAGLVLGRPVSASCAHRTENATHPLVHDRTGPRQRRSEENALRSLGHLTQWLRQSVPAPGEVVPRTPAQRPGMLETRARPRPPGDVRGSRGRLGVRRTDRCGPRMRSAGRSPRLGRTCQESFVLANSGRSYGALCLLPSARSQRAAPRQKWPHRSTSRVSGLSARGYRRRDRVRDEGPNAPGSREPAVG